MLNINGPVLRLQKAKIDIMEKLIVKIKFSYITISEPNKILFSSSKVRDYFSKVVEDNKIKCAFELLDVGKPADPSGNKEPKICFVALDQIPLEHAIGDLYILFTEELFKLIAERNTNTFSYISLYCTEYLCSPFEPNTDLPNYRGSGDF